jgi:dTDP-4-dehydrorhamnose reductase
MLGSAVLRALSVRRDWAVSGTQSRAPSSPNHLNAADPPDTWAHLIRDFDYVINCIGVLKESVNETDPAAIRKAITVNALFPHFLAEVAHSAGARVIHISTDGVFSGASATPYVETHPTDCSDVYGKTKALGECPAWNVLNIRCSIVGRDPVRHRGLIEKVLNAPEGAEVMGFDDQIWNGVTTVQFGALCRRILESEVFDRIREVSGIHHFAPNDQISKYELLCIIQQVSRKAVKIRRTKSNLPASARVLISHFAELSGLYPGGHTWPELIHRAIEEVPGVN